MPARPKPVTLNYSEAFLRQLKRLAKKYRRIGDDLKPLVDELKNGDTPGAQIQGVGYTVYKVRLPNTDAQRGASGGYRVVYYIQTADSRLLLTIYSKTEQSDVPDSALKRIIEQELGK